MKLPVNMGPEYRAQFEAIYPELARDFSAAYLPFLLEGVAGTPELNLPDGLHPTEEGMKVIAENVWGTLEPVLLERAPPERIFR
jgi:acyl-CoA thioesterase-1